MRQIPLGTKGTFTLRVLPEHLANRFKDAMLPQVLATPVMILIMENAALSAIRPFLDISESAVGTAINGRHLAATPVGHDVRAEAEVVKRPQSGGGAYARFTLVFTIDGTRLALAFFGKALVERTKIDHHALMSSDADLFHLVARRHLEFDSFSLDLERFVSRS